MNCQKYAFCNNWIDTNWSSWSFELQLVIDDFISITIKFKLWISFELKLKLKLTIPNLFS